jgi:hypothetical protein
VISGAPERRGPVVWLLEVLITLAEGVDRTVRTADVWAPYSAGAGLLGVVIGWSASGRIRRCPEASADGVHQGPDLDQDTETVGPVTCADGCPDGCWRTCPELSWRHRTTGEAGG